MATFLDSDENFMVFRRFGWIQSRLLLEKQWNITQLERELEELDDRDRREKPERLITRDACGPAADRRTEFFQRLEVQYNQYGMFKYTTLLSHGGTIADHRQPH